MTSDEILDRLKAGPVYKLTGPPEHWLTTFNTGFWGLTEPRWTKLWHDLNKGDPCLFHSTAVVWELLSNPKTAVERGVIGIGIVDRTDRKTSLEWVTEIERDENGWPLLIHFSDIVWFGDVASVKDRPIREKMGSVGQMRKEVTAIAAGGVPFKRFSEEGCSFPAQPSICQFLPEKRDSLHDLLEPYVLRSAVGTKSPDVGSKLRAIEETIERVGEFDAKNDEDARERSLASIVRRRGQPKFREALLSAYERQCAITGYDAPEALEAAHITPYKGSHTNHVSNGLLLRADLHTLFDLGLIAVDTSEMTLLVSEGLRGTMYEKLAGTPLLIPEAKGSQPSIEALDRHRADCGL